MMDTCGVTDVMLETCYIGSEKKILPTNALCNHVKPTSGFVKLLNEQLFV